MSDGGLVVGIIHHAKDDTEKPEFEIIRRDGYQSFTNPRPCEHGKFILDEKWASVTCGKCKERIDPFAALMHYAANFQAIERRHVQMVEAEKSNHFSELKRLSRLRDATEDERDEIAKLTGWSFDGTVEDLRVATNGIRRAIDERKWAKRTRTP